MIPFHLIFYMYGWLLLVREKGKLHKKPASKWCNYTQRLRFQKWSADFHYVMDLMGNGAEIVVVNMTAKLGLILFEVGFRQICKLSRAETVKARLFF